MAQRKSQKKERIKKKNKGVDRNRFSKSKKNREAERDAKEWFRDEVKEHCNY